jgi:exopolysaccharide biosynthesis polyprenyl glycosylphosphotransferase
MTSRVYLYNLLLRALVYFLPIVAFVISCYLLFGNQCLSIAVQPHYLILLLFTELAWIITADYYKLSSIAELFWEYTGIRAAFFACFVTLLLQAALLLFFRQLVIAQPFILFTNATLFLLVVAVRNFFRFTSTSSSWPRKCEKLLIVGTDRYAQKYVELLRRIPFFRCEIQAYLRLPGQPVHVKDATIVNAEQPLRLADLAFDEIVVALPAWRYPQLPTLIDSLQDSGKPIRAIFDLGPRLSLRDKLFQAGQLQMMNLAVAPVESFAYTVVKKSFDLVAAILGVMILSPIFAVVALLVRLSSPGPILFRQERVGRHGKHFNLLKFRTMYCSSKVESDTVWTTKNDPRCTPLGAVLRKFSLDELPQLFNVIRGDMSLVGPRPERPHFVAKFREDLERYNLRHTCEVGITGWAQINGLRGDTSISERLQYDLYYIHNWSLGMDLQIIFRTLVVALKDANGY